jgi:hypothetical protein
MAWKRMQPERNIILLIEGLKMFISQDRVTQSKKSIFQVLKQPKPADILCAIFNNALTFSIISLLSFLCFCRY